MPTGSKKGAEWAADKGNEGRGAGPSKKNIDGSGGDNKKNGSSHNGNRNNKNNSYNQERNQDRNRNRDKNTNDNNRNQRKDGKTDPKGISNFYENNDKNRGRNVTGPVRRSQNTSGPSRINTLDDRNVAIRTRDRSDAFLNTSKPTVDEQKDRSKIRAEADGANRSGMRDYKRPDRGRGSSPGEGQSAGQDQSGSRLGEGDAQPDIDMSGSPHRMADADRHSPSQKPDDAADCRRCKSESSAYVKSTWEDALYPPLWRWTRLLRRDEGLTLQDLRDSFQHVKVGVVEPLPGGLVFQVVGSDEKWEKKEKKNGEEEKDDACVVGGGGERERDILVPSAARSPGPERADECAVEKGCGINHQPASQPPEPEKEKEGPVDHRIATGNSESKKVDSHMVEKENERSRDLWRAAQSSEPGSGGNPAAKDKGKRPLDHEPLEFTAQEHKSSVPGRVQPGPHLLNVHAGPKNHQEQGKAELVDTDLLEAIGQQRKGSGEEEGKTNLNPTIPCVEVQQCLGDKQGRRADPKSPLHAEESQQILDRDSREEIDSRAPKTHAVETGIGGVVQDEIARQDPEPLGQREGFEDQGKEEIDPKYREPESKESESKGLDVEVQAMVADREEEDLCPEMKEQEAKNAGSVHGEGQQDDPNSKELTVQEQRRLQKEGKDDLADSDSQIAGFREWEETPMKLLQAEEAGELRKLEEAGSPEPPLPGIGTTQATDNVVPNIAPDRTEYDETPAKECPHCVEYREAKEKECNIVDELLPVKTLEGMEIGFRRLRRKRAMQEMLTPNLQALSSPMALQYVQWMQRGVTRSQFESGQASMWVLYLKETNIIVSSCVTQWREAVVSTPKGAKSARAAVITQLYTLPSYRQQGLATQLLRRVHEALDELKTPVLMSVIYGCDHAPFFQRLGFRAHRADELRILLDPPKPVDSSGDDAGQSVTGADEESGDVKANKASRKKKNKKKAAAAPDPSAGPSKPLRFSRPLACIDVKLLINKDVDAYKLCMTSRRDEDKTFVRLVPSGESLSLLYAWRRAYRACLLDRTNRRTRDPDEPFEKLEVDGPKNFGWFCEDEKGRFAAAWWVHDFRARKLFMGGVVRSPLVEQGTLATVLRQAVGEARTWGLREVVLWNPSRMEWAAATEVARDPGAGMAVVLERRRDSVPYMRWRGGEERVVR